MASLTDPVASAPGSDFLALAALMVQRYHISAVEITSAAAGLGKSGSLG
jgi:hypothetical protein